MHSSKKKLIEIPTELFDKIVRLASENWRGHIHDHDRTRQQTSS